MTAISILACSALLILAYTFIGQPVARTLFKPDSQDHDSFTPLAAPLCGYLIFHFLLYSLSSLTANGIAKIALPLLALLVALSYWQQRRSPQPPSLIPLAILPVASALLLLPAVLHNWEMYYALGNDSARYLAMITYLQDHFWVFDGMLEQPLRYPFGNRPLMHYEQASPTALLGISANLAYTVSSCINAGLTACSLALLVKLNTPSPSRWSTAIVAIFTATWGGFIGYFYSGFLAHVFSVTSFFFCLSLPHWRLSPALKTGAAAIIFMIVTTSYSIGFSILAAAMTIISIGFSRKTIQNSLRAEILSTVVGLLLAGFFFHSEIGKAGSFLEGRNQAYYQPLLDAILIYSGTTSKWLLPGIPAPIKIGIAAVIVALLIYTLYSAFKNCVHRLYFYALSTLALSSLGIWLAGNYYLFNKISITLTPLFFIPLLFKNKTAATARKQHLFPAAVLGLITLSGAFAFKELYYPVLLDRKTYGDAEIRRAEKSLHEKYGHQPALYISDTMLERLPLLRVHFQHATMLSLSTPSIQEEMAGNATAFSKADSFDAILVPKDYIEPHHAQFQGISPDLFQGNWFNLYSHNFPAIDLVGNWESTRAPARENSNARFMGRIIPAKDGAIFARTPTTCAFISVEVLTPATPTTLTLTVAGKPYVHQTSQDSPYSQMRIPCPPATAFTIHTQSSQATTLTRVWLTPADDAAPKTAPTPSKATTTGTASGD